MESCFIYANPHADTFHLSRMKCDHDDDSNCPYVVGSQRHLTTTLKPYDIETFYSYRQSPENGFDIAMIVWNRRLSFPPTRQTRDPLTNYGHPRQVT